ADGIGEGGTLQGEVAAVLRGEVGEIEFRDGGGGVGIDDDVVAAIGLADDADARQIVPGGEDLIGDGLPLGVANGEQGGYVFVVVDQEGDQGEGQRHTAGAPADRPRQAVPDGGGGGEGDGGGDHRVRTAHQLEQRQKEQASGGGEVEEIDPVDLLDGFADGEGDDGAGGEEGQGGGEVDQGQVPVGEIVSLGQEDGKRQDDEQAIGDAETPQLGEQRGLPGGHHIGKHAAQSQSEERDGDGEEGEVVVEHHRENTREGEFQQQRRHGGESDAQVDLTRLSGVWFHGCQL